MSVRGRHFRFFSLALCLLIAACAFKSNQTTNDYRSSTYLCDEGRLFSAQFDQNGQRAAILFNGQTHTLTRSENDPDDGATRRYRDNIHTLIIRDGRTLSLERADVPLFRNCSNLDTVKS